MAPPEPLGLVSMASSSTPAAARVLVVDDEWSIRDLLTTVLEFAGYEVRASVDGTDAMRQIALFSPDLILLDINMPGADGFDVCRRIRAQGLTTPVIFLTARDDPDDVVAGLGMGADDYLTKPLVLKVVAAHIDAVLRRARADTQTTQRLECGRIVVDDGTHQVTADGTEVALSPTEYRLLRYLLENAGHVVSKLQVLDAVWQFDFDGDASVVDTFMSTLRRKVDPPPSRVLHTVRGFGYTARDDERR
jgi:two-component system, OmpR family, response regulator